MFPNFDVSKITLNSEQAAFLASVLAFQGSINAQVLVSDIESFVDVSESESPENTLLENDDEVGGEDSTMLVSISENPKDGVNIIFCENAPSFFDILEEPPEQKSEEEKQK